MLHQTLSKGRCRDGSGLLPGLIVRPRGRLVEAQPLLGATENRSPSSAHRLGGPHPGHPRPVVDSLSQRERLLALRMGAPALLLPESLFPKPVRPQGTGSGARDVLAAARLRPRTRRAFGALAHDGHYPGGSNCEGEGFWQGTPLRAGDLRTQRRLQNRVSLRVQGGAGGGSRGRGEHLLSGPCGPSDERPIGEALIASDRHDTYLADKGFTGVGATLAGRLRDARCCHPEEHHSSKR
jgi:hypothetical protein